MTAEHVPLEWIGEAEALTPEMLQAAMTELMEVRPWVEPRFQVYIVCGHRILNMWWWHADGRTAWQLWDDAPAPHVAADGVCATPGRAYELANCATAFVAAGPAG